MDDSTSICVRPGLQIIWVVLGRLDLDTTERSEVTKQKGRAWRLSFYFLQASSGTRAQGRENRNHRSITAIISDDSFSGRLRCGSSPYAALLRALKSAGVAGNGERMSEVPKEQQAEEESAARKSKAAGRVIKERKDAGLMKAVGAGKARKAIAELAKAGAKIAGAKKAATKRNTPRHSEKDGAEMLKQASDQALVEITGVVVDKLKAGAKEGKLDYVKTLLSFSEKKKPKVKLSRGLSHNLRLIEELANEPQWVGPAEVDLDVG